KGFYEWVLEQNADVICLQELKAQELDLAHETLQLPGYTGFYHCAVKKGYSGVGILTRYQPQNVIKGLGWSTADEEGRYVQVDFGKLSIVSLYLPSGTSGEIRQNIKYDFLSRFEKHLQEKCLDREFIICGDWNIAHTKMDLKNWRGNQKNSGFLPDERAWMDKLFGSWGFVDAFRVINQEPEQYTWWSHRGQAWAKNVGWRIDYQVVTPGLKDFVRNAFIYKEKRFSDHAPLVMDYHLAEFSLS
ncbi:MAG TPA: exodeoxyribonuclease III, partial [Gammaproteobacteria bacterium]|nr:exodeoxyribonuclease III [Gammaproteobacteria bacterium]